VAAKSANDVAIGLAERVRDAVVAVGRKQVAEIAGRLQPRLGQLDLLERDRLLDLVDLESEPLTDRRRYRFQRRPVRLLGLVPPPPVLEASRRLYQCTPRIR
jgi:hypothetical protein